ncbi:RICIN domain-containing protein [Streptomyces sp. NBC_01340]|uniref:RICIN domain-containing protein n=1 Tax=unclassified Streptomyces TaxID=2593676 RepID=UPI00224F5F8B|nr:MULTISPECIES: RICIN domain-containing protein [unclassified Streptomyces]MCX4451765.1 RICIN domain-containing protein [Streptomyces sp. NBC_01719]MCX4491125.1 RICIN domain-containing protein [Streptomyces sp. NBC_01728]WSI36448.1 RICIN domain-containing protein [Streptomyces sp. NBC_01340]
MAALVATTVSGIEFASQDSASAAAAAIPTGYTTVVNKGSGKCVDARSAASADGTAVQQYTCNGSTAQNWQLVAGSDGYYRVNSNLDATKAWDVTDVSTADSAPVQLWTYSGGNNQQWLPVAEADGAYHFVNRNSGKCLDVPSASTSDSVQLAQYTCNGTAAQSFTLGGGTTNPPGTPDFGPNVTVFDPSMSASSIQSKLDSVFSQQETNQFGSARQALLFKPGTYSANANVGFYTQVAGLGFSPDDVTINGSVHAEADWFQGNATQNFWRDAENLSVNPTGGTDRWAVSQAAPYRRMHVRGNLALDDGGWSSGGFISDTKVDGQIQSGTQQQFLTRNSQMGSWSGSNWNMVFVGDQGAPAQSFPTYTNVASSPTIREKPFLYVDSAGAYQVFVPGLQSNAVGTTWSGKTPAGKSLPIDQFYIVKPGVTAADMNSALAAGKNLLVTPGVYHLNQTINITRADTVVLGMGLATFVPDGGITAVTTADVDGIQLAGLLIDAGTTNSATLMQIGPAGSSATHAADPTQLSDVFIRIGGATVGKATNSLVINSANTIIDHTWIWRADHGNSGTVGWTTNTADNGLTVNGNNVTAYGLFVEHYQKTQVIWNGNGGRTYFFQNEMPYDPPNQASWMNGTGKGYPAYKVAASVTSHEAWGLGSYCYFSANSSVVADHAFEVPSVSGVKFHDMVTVSLGGVGTISHIINSTGGPSNSSTNVAYLTNFP